MRDALKRWRRPDTIMPSSHPIHLIRIPFTTFHEVDGSCWEAHCQREVHCKHPKHSNGLMEHPSNDLQDLEGFAQLYQSKEPCQTQNAQDRKIGCGRALQGCLHKERNNHLGNMKSFAVTMCEPFAHIPLLEPHEAVAEVSKIGNV